MAITYEDIEKEALKIIEENPTFKYGDFRAKQLGLKEFIPLNSSCSYIDEDGNGSCLFGRILTNLGLNSEEIAVYEGDGIDSVLNVFNIETTHEQSFFLSALQSNQDKNYEYADVLENAKEELESYLSEDEIYV